MARVEHFVESKRPPTTVSLLSQEALLLLISRRGVHEHLVELEFLLLVNERCLRRETSTTGRPPGTGRRIRIVRNSNRYGRISSGQR